LTQFAGFGAITWLRVFGHWH